MKWWKVMPILLLTIGFGVALLSVYKASVDGLFRKVGLIGSDFGAAVVQEKISQAMMETRGKIACDLPTRIRGAVGFILSSDEEQGRLSFRLGESRIKCGAVMLADGNAEVGTYEILKGMGYLEQGYQFVNDRMSFDNRVCEGLPEAELNTTVSEVLSATSGKVYELIWNDWQKIKDLKTKTEDYCVDQRLKTR